MVSVLAADLPSASSTMHERVPRSATPGLLVTPAIAAVTRTHILAGPGFVVDSDLRRGVVPADPQAAASGGVHVGSRRHERDARADCVLALQGVLAVFGAVVPVGWLARSLVADY